MMDAGRVAAVKAALRCVKAAPTRNVDPVDAALSRAQDAILRSGAAVRQVRETPAHQAQRGGQFGQQRTTFQGGLPRRAYIFPAPEGDYAGPWQPDKSGMWRSPSGQNVREWEQETADYQENRRRFDQRAYVHAVRAGGWPGIPPGQSLEDFNRWEQEKEDRRRQHADAWSRSGPEDQRAAMQRLSAEAVEARELDALRRTQEMDDFRQRAQGEPPRSAREQYRILFGKGRLTGAQKTAPWLGRF